MGRQTEVYLYTFFNPGATRGGGQGFTPRKDIPVPIVQQSGRVSGPMWTDTENLPPPAPTVVRTPDRLARSNYAMPAAINKGEK